MLDELKQLPQWVGWRVEGSKKMPINPLTGKRAQTNKQDTWGSYEEAAAAVEEYGLAGLGFVFTSGDGLTGIDIDKCIGEDGRPNAIAEYILTRFPSYTELSPSGRGLHVIVRGSVGSAITMLGLELYSQGRYFTMSMVPWSPA